jgi:hypothetical protein
MRIKAIACDVDGTITDASWKIIHPEAVESIRRAEDMGIPVILATARTITHMKRMFENFDFKTSGPIIAENGGIVLNQRTGEEVLTGNMGKVKKASAVIMEKAKGLVKIRHTLARRSDIVLEGPMEAIKRIQRIILSQNLGIDLTYTHLPNDLEKKVEPSKTKYIIFIKDPKVNKGNGLIIATKMLRIESTEAAAIGDAENDVSMLRVAGFGIAVANADQELKKVANLVTKGPYGRGAKEAIDFVLDNLI